MNRPVVRAHESLSRKNENQPLRANRSICRNDVHLDSDGSIDDHRSRTNLFIEEERTLNFTLNSIATVSVSAWIRVNGGTISPRPSLRSIIRRVRKDFHGRNRDRGHASLIRPPNTEIVDTRGSRSPERAANDGGSLRKGNCVLGRDTPTVPLHREEE